ncbi:4403_t:CDS:2 [Entrophospora sp. SA101]|nr:4403_t:CDS:2 [Entrophospora sp. SA101]
MPPAIERTIYTEEELLSNDEILNEPPPPYSEYPLVTNSVVQNRHQAVNSSNNYGQQIPLSSSIAVSNNNPFFQIFNSTISQPLSSTSSSLSLNRMSGRHGARMNFLQGGDITSRFQQELDEDDSCCFAPLTSVVCLVSLLNPPLAYIIFLITAASYRMLGRIGKVNRFLYNGFLIDLTQEKLTLILSTFRIELATQSFFGGQPKFYHENRYYQIYYPPVFCLDNSVIINSISSSSTTNNNYSFYSLVSNFLKSTLNYIADEYTWRYYTSAIVKDLHPDFMYDSNNQREEKPAVTMQKNEISSKFCDQYWYGTVLRTEALINAMDRVNNKGKPPMYNYRDVEVRDIDHDSDKETAALNIGCAKFFGTRD